MKKTILTICIICATMGKVASAYDFTPRDNTTNHVGNIGVSAVVSYGTYYFFHKVIGIEDKFGCVALAMMTTNFIMLWNIHTAESTDMWKIKLTEHVVGSAIVIPIAIFDK